MQRTPYSCAPYGPDQFKKSISPSETMMEEGYIVVYQDVRGRWMSDGLYDNMRAYILIKIKTDVDEASDI
jgi:predicted acyl esterase